MTKEEIFNKHSFAAIRAISPSKDFCLKAMVEYARQQVIEFDNWKIENGWINYAHGVLFKSTDPSYGKSVGVLYNQFIEQQNKE